MSCEVQQCLHLQVVSQASSRYRPSWHANLAHVVATVHFSTVCTCRKVPAKYFELVPLAASWSMGVGHPRKHHSRGWAKLTETAAKVSCFLTARMAGTLAMQQALTMWLSSTQVGPAARRPHACAPKQNPLWLPRLLTFSSSTQGTGRLSLLACSNSLKTCLTRLEACTRESQCLTWEARRAVRLQPAIISATWQALISQASALEAAMLWHESIPRAQAD